MSRTRLLLWRLLLRFGWATKPCLDYTHAGPDQWHNADLTRVAQWVLRS